MEPPLQPLEACREQALKLLDIRPHSIAELKRKLFQRKKYPATDIYEVINDLINVNLLNDMDFAILFCESMKMASPPIGRLKAKLKLRLKGIPADIIDEAMTQAWNDDDEEDNDEARALMAARRKWSSLNRQKDQTSQQKRMKLARHLASRGFVSQVVSAILRKEEFR